MGSPRRTARELRHRAAIAIAVVAGVALGSSGGPDDPVGAVGPRTEGVTAPTPFVEAFAGGVVTTVGSPTAIEQLPNGRVVVLEQATGRVRLIDPATRQLLPQPAIDLAVCGGSERGLLGFTHDPDFGRTGRVYAFYTRPAPGAPGGCVNRVSAFTMVGDTILHQTEQVLIDNISSVNGNHNAGDLEVGNDGFLYVTTGDAGRDPRGDSGSGGSNDAARDLSLLNGKILRLDRFTGGPAPGNPIGGSGAVACGSRGNTPSTPGTWCREIFAWGLRNPYRFAFDPNTSATRFFINDVGQSTFEEVDDGRLGADYGWPLREGACPQGDTPPCPAPPAGLVDPIVAYPRSTGTYITGGAFVPDGAWPAEYDGGYLFADGGTGRIWLRRANGTVDWGAPLVTDAWALADMAFVWEPDGLSLYYTLNSSGQVRRLAAPTGPATPTVPATFDDGGGPTRVFDSREQQPAARLRGGTTRLIDLEAPSDARSALVNVTLVRPAGPTYATAWEPRRPRPSSANVNAADGEVVANASVVPLDASGRMLLYVRATTHVVVDVLGYFRDAPAARTAGRYQRVEASRLVDTRDPSTALNSYSTVSVSGVRTVHSVPVAGRAGVPKTGAGHVVVNLTGLSGSREGSGFVTAYEGGGAPPVHANVNVNGTAGGVSDRRGNLAVVPIGADGTIRLLLHDVDDVVVDVVGWFTDTTVAASTDGRFRRLDPARVVDTRVQLGLAPLGPGATATYQYGPPISTADAVVHNLTLAPSADQGFLTAYPTGGSPPPVSNANATGPGQVRAALAVTPLSSGRVTFFSQRGTQLVVDAFGYFD